MGKAVAPRALKENEAKAVARMLRVSPQKLNLLAQLIRGKKVDKALADLEFTRKRSALDGKKPRQTGPHSPPRSRRPPQAQRALRKKSAGKRERQRGEQSQS